jgi:O-antigen/teichoic acid export membrane protein
MQEHLGPVLFGTWLTMMTLYTAASFLDFGIGNAATTRLSEAFGRRDLKAIRRISAEAYSALLAISALLLLCLAVSYVLAPSAMFNFVHTGQAGVVAAVFAALFLSFPGGMIWRLLQAQQKFISSQLAQSSGPLLAWPLCLWAIDAGFSPLGVVTLYALTNPLVLASWTLAYFARHPHSRPDFRCLHWSSLRDLSQLGSAFFALSIFTLVGMNADNIVIAANAGAEVVAEYGVPAKLGSILMLLVGTMFMPLWPLFGSALAQNDSVWLRTTILRMSVFGAGSVMILGIFLTIFTEKIIYLWMHSSFPNQQCILLGWTATATVIALTAPYNMLLNASGKVRQQICPWCLFVVISILLKVIFINENNSWIAPWITALIYLIIITYPIIVMARGVVKK